jgi:hypothetical protein
MRISFDIDGTVTDYPKHWLNYLNQKVGSAFIEVRQAKVILGNETYSRIKHEYRMGPEKYLQPVCEVMVRLSHEIYELGGMVFFNSSRPFDRYPEMLQKTSTWLSHYGFLFEQIYLKNGSNMNDLKIDIHLEDELSEVERIRNEGYLKSCIVLGETAIRSRTKSDLAQCDKEQLRIQLLNVIKNQSA